MSAVINNGGLPIGGTPEETLEALARLQMTKDLGMNVGPVMIGLVFDLVLFGFSLHQMAVFSQYPAHDRRFISFLVYWTFGVGTFTTGYGMYYTWTLFVNGFGSFLNFYVLDKVAFYAILGTCVTIPVQTFYLDRAYRLFGRKKWIIGIAIPLMLGTVIGGIGATVSMRTMKGYDDLDKLEIWFYVWDVITVVTDLYLTILMLVGLSRAKTGFVTTDVLVSRLIRMSAEAQIVPTLGAVGFLITYSIERENKINFFWFMMLGKTYVVSLLAVLNFRVTTAPLKTLGTVQLTATSGKQRPLSGVGLYGDHVYDGRAIPLQTFDGPK